MAQRHVHRQRLYLHSLPQIPDVYKRQALAIVGLTLAQESKGKGLSGAIMGDNSMMEAGRTRAKDAKMAKATKILGIVFIVVTILVSVLLSLIHILTRWAIPLHSFRTT